MYMKVKLTSFTLPYEDQIAINLAEQEKLNSLASTLHHAYFLYTRDALKQLILLSCEKKVKFQLTDHFKGKEAFRKQPN